MTAANQSTRENMTRDKAVVMFCPLTKENCKADLCMLWKAVLNTQYVLADEPHPQGPGWTKTESGAHWVRKPRRHDYWAPGFCSL